jgi:ATP/maltotriose-dependent transcriptional regulator MalT
MAALDASEGGRGWWLEALGALAGRRDGGETFFNAVTDAITPVQHRAGASAEPMWQGRRLMFRDLRGIMLVMQQDLEKAATMRSAVRTRLRELEAMTTGSDAEAALVRAAHCFRCLNPKP